jgi:hypothetical protein
MSVPKSLADARSMTSVDECLGQDYRVSLRFLDHHDLPEGIRAAILGKDRSPHWKPATLREVTPDMVARHFAPPATGDLSLLPRTCDLVPARGRTWWHPACAARPGPEDGSQNPASLNSGCVRSQAVRTNGTVARKP